MNENRNEFDEMCVNTIFALNGLMQTREVCKAGKAVTKINRFKQWVMELQDSVNGQTENAPCNPTNAPALPFDNDSDSNNDSEVQPVKQNSNEKFCK